MKPSKAIAQYLERYAEKAGEIDAIAAMGPYAEAVVVPLCGEDALVDGMLEALEVAAETVEGTTLVIAVVNDDPRTTPGHRAANAALLHRLPALERFSPQLVLAVLDRRQIFERCGVGTARKVGSDLALALHAQGRLQSEWIHTTDADARVAPDYFQLRPTTSVPWGLGPLANGAFVHPFHHELEGEHGPALHLYDAFLHYYTAGLARAGSPFAFQTIGSTISFSAQAYAQVRGFPKKDAGEDFYFLHKLAKVAYVWPGGGEVRLVCRASDRVPFGTGQSIAKIENLLNEGSDYRVYNARIFEELASWFRAVDALAEELDWEAATRDLSAPLREALEAMGVRQAAEGMSAHATPEARLRYFHTWFDGFKTLKLVHALRDSTYPNEPLAGQACAHRAGGRDHGFERALGVFDRHPL